MDKSADTDHVRTILGDLIRRQRAAGLDSSDASLLQANRLGIAYWHRRLTLDERHRPQDLLEERGDSKPRPRA